MSDNTALWEEIGILQADKATCLGEIERLTNELNALKKRMHDMELAFHDHVQLSPEVQS